MKKPIVAVTMGDAAGVGPEIVLKAMCREEVFDVCRPLIIGSAQILEACARMLAIPASVTPVSSIEDHAYTLGQAAVYECGSLGPDDFTPGTYNASCGKAMLAWAEEGIRLCLAGRVHGVVGGPHAKKSVDLAGVEFHGYPDFVAGQTGSKQCFLMLVSGSLRVCNATLHVPMRQACDLISRDLVLNAILEVHKAVVRLGIPAPKIAVAGLNCHAGEEGMFGTEEIDSIRPAVEDAVREGIDARGPYAGDSLFYGCLENKYDAYLGMYHDQAHIALKTVAFEQSGGLVLGTPIVFATVGHGAAFDIAWRNKAFPTSLAATIRLVASVRPDAAGASV